MCVCAHNREATQQPTIDKQLNINNIQQLKWKTTFDIRKIIKEEFIDMKKPSCKSLFYLNVANKRDQQIFLFLYFPLKQCLIGAIKNLLVSSLNV